MGWVEQVRKAAIEIIESSIAAEKVCSENGWDMGSFVLRGISKPESVVTYPTIQRAVDAQLHLRDLTRTLMDEQHLSFFEIRRVYNPILCGI